MCYPLGVAKPDRKAWLMVSGHLKNQLPRGETEPASMSCAVVPLTTGDRKPEREAAGKVIASHNGGRGPIQREAGLDTEYQVIDL